MLKPLRPVALTIVAAAASIGLLAGCSTTSEVSQDNLQKEVAAQLKTKVGQIDETKCDGGLEAKVDATQKCQIKVDGQWVDTEVKATSVDGDNVKFDIDVNDEQMPTGITLATLQDTVAKRYAEIKQRPADEVVCAGMLRAEVGATQKCKLRIDSEWYDVDVTATQVQGTNVNFNFKVASTPTTPPSN